MRQKLFDLRNTLGRKNHKWTQAMNTARLEVKRGFLTTRILVTLSNVEVLERNVEENEVTE